MRCDSERHESGHLAPSDGRKARPSTLHRRKRHQATTNEHRPLPPCVARRRMDWPAFGFCKLHKSSRRVNQMDFVAKGGKPEGIGASPAPNVGQRRQAGAAGIAAQSSSSARTLADRIQISVGRPQETPRNTVPSNVLNVRALRATPRAVAIVSESRMSEVWGAAAMLERRMTSWVLVTGSGASSALCG